MSQKEVVRSKVLDKLMLGEINQKDAAIKLEVTPRQVRRLLKRYQILGLSGLVSLKRGLVSNRRLSEATYTLAANLIGKHYWDFGPTLVAEKLAAVHGIKIAVESTRKLMIKAGYWKPKRGANIRVHPMRDRRPCFGEMIQIDGSPHDWFEGRSETCTLLVFIDDATGRLTGLRFEQSETTLGYMHLLHDHITQFGVPASLYSDKHGIFRINAKNADPDSETQFTRAARELGIGCIHANSPQAKGRVERANQTLQDRLVKEMRLARINDMVAANEWLPNYIKIHNDRFAVIPQETRDAHGEYSGTQADLMKILSIQRRKKLSKNISCQHSGQLFQITSTGKGLGLRGAQVVLHEYFTGGQEIIWGKRVLNFSVMDAPAKQSGEVSGKDVNMRVNAIIDGRCHGHKPAANHPWKMNYAAKKVFDRQHEI